MTKASFARERKVKRKSISHKVGGGLGAILLALGFMSSLSLYGFYTLRLGLESLSQESVPRIVESASVSRAINQLLTRTERLLAANTEPVRRSTYTDIIENLSELQDLTQRSGITDVSMEARILALKEILSELNELVAYRIEISVQMDNSVARLFDFTEKLQAFKSSMIKSQLNTQLDESISEWDEITNQIIHLGGHAVTLKSRYQINRRLKALNKLFSQLNRATWALPENIRGEAHQMEGSLKTHVLGNNGVIPLTIEQIEITLQNSGRGNFARILVDDATSTIVADFNTQLSFVSERTKAITEKGNLLAFSFSVLALISFVVIGVVIIYFHKNVVRRLLDLNSSILQKVEGKDVAIDETGNDEITEMARSFLFYESEVNLREEKLTQLAMKDPLTGVGNRRDFMKRGEDLTISSARFKHPLVLMMMDIDHFKTVNDIYGHNIGDEMLKGVATLCLKNLRGTDVFARIGGEEFAALLPETDIDGALLVCEKIRNKLSEEKWILEGNQIHCTVSMGLATYNYDKPDSLEVLMKNADDSLYEAKNSGRNCIKVY